MRQRGGSGRVLELYYQPGDPHSHLCAQLLSELQRRLHIPVQVYVVPEPASDCYPEAEKQRLFARQDAAQIAPAYGLHMPGLEPPCPDDCLRAARTLLGARNVDDFVRREAICAGALFRAEDITAAARPFAALDLAATERQLAANAKRRERLGHYLPAMWQFNGEWFWALDRLGFLEQRLRAQGVLSGSESLVTRHPALATWPEDSVNHSCDFWFSFRSPYSYLAAMDWAAKPQYHKYLNVRPVLPMVMRGLPVPQAKRLYIVRDAQRLADASGVPFGRIVDPVGSGVRRCLAVFPLAEGVGQQLAFLCAAGRACWGEGIDLATDAGLRYAVEQAGMSWSRARAMLTPPLDIDYAEKNQQDLFAAGLWGVPSYKMGEWVSWGQDRHWLLQSYWDRAATEMTDSFAHAG
nr:DsbA family protein [Oceanococcus sp. HetDA_MAG_MS8]